MKIALILSMKEFDIKLKSTLFAGVLTASLALTAFANDAPVAKPLPTETMLQAKVEVAPKPEIVTALPQFTAQDTQMLFEQDAKPMQLAALSQQEMMETEGAWIPLAIGAFHAFNYARYAIGPVRAWARMGPSFSQSSQIATNAIRWGSNPHYQQQIGSSTLRNLNNSLHNSRLPGSSWRVQDRGHFHVGRR